MGKAAFGATNKRSSKPPVDLPAMTDEKQIHSLLCHIKVVDHPIIPHAQAECVRSLQTVMGRCRQITPQGINGLGNTDLCAGWQGFESLCEGLRPDLCGRWHTEPYKPSGLRTADFPVAISPRARAMASTTSSRTTNSSSILSSSHVRRRIRSARDKRSAACSNSCTVLMLDKVKREGAANQLSASFCQLQTEH